jgi:hypothetical protein
MDKDVKMKRRGNTMKKVMFLFSVLICFGIAQNAEAYPVQVDDTIILSAGNYNTTTRAGEFTFTITRSGTDIGTIDTFCLEYDEITYLDTPYTIDALIDGSETTYSNNWNLIAYLYWSYNQGTLEAYENGVYSDDANGWSYLQYAIWILVGDSEYVSVDNQAIANYYIKLANDVAGGETPEWTNDGRVVIAVNDGQDILATAPVPEPATLMLFGTGLLGLGVFTRKKFRK